MSDRKLSVRAIALRFIIGQPLDGRKRTNATFFRSGEVSLNHADRPGRWSFLAGYVKVAARLVMLALFIGLIVAWVNGDRWIVYTVIGLILGACVGDIALWIYERRKETAAERMPWSVKFKGDIREFIEERNDGSVRPVIGLTYGRAPVLLDLDADSPHAVASFGTGGGKSTLLRGLLAQLLHDGVEHATIIDPKLISLEEFKNHPRVTYAVTYPEMWGAIQREADIMQDRYQQMVGNAKLSFGRRVLIVEEGNSLAAELRIYWQGELGGKGPPPILTQLALILFKGRQANVNIIGAYQRLSVQSVGTGEARDQFGYRIMTRFSVQAWKSLVGTNPIPRSPRHRGRALVVIGEDIIPVQMVAWTPAEALAHAITAEDTGVAATPGVLQDIEDVPDLGKLQDPVIPAATPDPVTGPPSSQVNGASSNTGSLQDLKYPLQEGDDVSHGPDAHISPEIPITAIIPDEFQVTLNDAIRLGIVGCAMATLRGARQRGQLPDHAGKKGTEYTYTAGSLREWDLTRNRLGYQGVRDPDNPSGRKPK